jgi:hypothetical protein
VIESPRAATSTPGAASEVVLVVISSLDAQPTAASPISSAEINSVGSAGEPLGGIGARRRDERGGGDSLRCTCHRTGHR